ncbi:MAG TPA: hypothetical protein DCW68_01930 [Rhodospirillaceae bacterium]|nr:MAG: hypothetical protein A2018_04895 [Alphaproteobacteria bacterium GWF2_58_20]HAU28854.1 hypothetical protein [Rhodospirillaceae bacterium]
MTKENSPAHNDPLAMPEISLQEANPSSVSVLHLESASKAFAAAQENTDPVLQDTATRLSLSTQNLMQSYDAWAENMENMENMRSLSDAMRNLRRVTSRIEIEMAAMAVAEPDEDAMRPIPVPLHRAARQLM